MSRYLLLQALLFTFILSCCLADDTSCVEETLSKLELSSLVWDNVNLVVHRNGETEPCSISGFDKAAFQKATREIVNTCPDSTISKYQMESLLTTYFRDQLDQGACGSTDNSTAPAGLRGFCDMGPLRTTIQPDNLFLVEQPDGSLPCRFFTREGRRIASVQDLIELADKAVQNKGKCEEQDHTCQSAPNLHLYAVPAGRLFMFAPSYVGEKFILDHVDGPDDESKVVLEVISLDPRLFEIYDFFSKEDASALIEKTLAEKSEEYGLHRSRTGATSKTVYNKRTSENAWDTAGEKAREIKG